MQLRRLLHHIYFITTWCSAKSKNLESKNIIGCIELTRRNDLNQIYLDFTFKASKPDIIKPYHDYTNVLIAEGIRKRGQKIMWPTPVQDDVHHRKQKYQQGGTALSTKAGGSLNPTWVEWLMGYPEGWTDLKD